MATKSVIILDHRSHMLAPTDQIIAIDDLKASKSKWTVLMESAVEYTRIIMDVCFTNHQVLVATLDTSLSFLNSWEDQVGVVDMVTKLALSGPPVADEDGREESSLLSAIKECVDCGLSESQLDVSSRVVGSPIPNHVRIVCFTSLSKPRDLVDAALNYIKDLESTAKVDIIIFNMVDHVIPDKDDVINDSGYHIYNVKPAFMFKKVLDTCLQLHNLTITTITSIPMKEELGTNTQAAAYNVDIVHPLVRLPCSSGNRLTMKWCSPKSAQNITHSDCIATYPVTPLDVSERPTICLVNFLLVGKQVILEYPNPNISVVLVNHSNTITMHYIANAPRSILHDIIPITETPGGKVTNYRTEEVVTLCLPNLLLAPHPLPPPDIPQSELPVMRSLLDLERRLAVFPSTYANSPLHNCGLAHIFGILSKSKLTDREVTDCQQVIYRVQGIELKKEPIKTRASRRDDPIQELWSELEKFILAMSDISPQHSKVKDCFYKIRKQSIAESDLYLSLKDQEEGEAEVEENGGAANAMVTSGSRKRDYEAMVLDTSIPVIKSHKTSHSQLDHPSKAGDKVTLVSILPKVKFREFPGRLNGVMGPEQLYADFQQKSLHPLSKKGSSSPYNSPKHSPRSFTREKSAGRPEG